MAKFEVGQCVKVTGNLHWVGEGTVRALYETDVSVIMLTGKMSGEIGAFRPSDLEPIETFQPGDIVRAEKGDDAIQGYIRKYEEGVFALMVWSDQLNLDLDDLESDGYTFTLVKRPEPEIVLPTKPYAIVFAGRASHIRGFGEMWYLAFGKYDDGITSGQLLAKATADKDYRVIFEGENE